MRTNLTHQLRAILKSHPEGLSTVALSNMTGRNNTNVGRLLHNMPDVYIDRWEKYKFGAHNVGYQAVWCIVTPPDNCPHPTREVVAVRSRTRKDSSEDEREEND